MNVYDFDKTIYNGDSTFHFYLFCLKRHKIILKLTPKLAKNFFLFKVKKITKTQFKESMYEFLKYVDIDTDLPDFWDSHIKNIKAWYLQKQCENDVIISASPEFLLKPACDRLKIKNLMASRVDPHTGKYTGVNCSGEEKVRRYREVFGDKKIDEFYSDSESDMPLVRISEFSQKVKGERLCSW